jgi:Ca2+-binding RTX toxin-like protein
MSGSSSVTVPGTSPGVPVTVALGTGDVLHLAQQIGALLSTLQGSSALDAQSGTIGSLPSPTAGGGTKTELMITGNVSGSATIPAGWNYVVDNSTVPTTVSGANLALITGTAGGSFNVSGQSTVAVEGGNNSVSASGLYMISTASGNNTVSATGIGTVATDIGSNLIGVSGINDVLSVGHDTVLAGVGLTTVNSAGSNSLIFGNANGQGLLTVTDTGSNDTVAGMGSATTVTAGAGSHGLFVFGSSGSLTFVGGSTAATVLGSSIGSSVVGGSGGVLFGSEGHDTVSGKAPGGATIFGTSGHDVTYLGAGNLLYAATAGSETLNAAGSSGTNALFAVGSANASIMGGSGTNLYDAGAGADTFTGGSGSNTYFFLAANTAGSHDFITGLSSTDAVGLIGYDSTASSISVANGSATLTLSDKTQITFLNVTNINNNIHYG